MEFEKIYNYIENLYKDDNDMNRRAFIEGTELKDFIPVVDAKEIIPNLNGEFDMIFQDVDKRLYPVLFQECLRLLKKGGILAAEDTLFPVLDLDDKWNNLIEPIEQFNNLVVNCKELKSTLLPIGDGLIVAVKNS